MESAVRRLAEDSGNLAAVRGESAAGGGFAALAFDFPSGTLHCRCNVDTDEVIVEVVEAASLGYPAVRDESLTRLAGLALEYAWEMTNHRGYTDGFQIRFSDGEGYEQTRQIEVAAAAMTLRLVSDQADIANPS